MAGCPRTNTIAMEGAEELSTVHALAFPLLAQGHIIPFMRLCNLLSSKGLNVVLLTTPLTAKHLRAQQNNVTVMDILLPRLPDLPDGAESTDHLPPSLVKTLISATEHMEPAFTQIVARLRPKCLIADLTPLFLPVVASTLKIPVIYYPTTGAYSLSIMHSLISSLPLLEGEAIVALPGLPKPTTIPDTDILPPYRGAGKNDPIYFLATVFHHFRDFSCGLVLNTVYEMEAEFVAHIECTFGVPVWTVGPVISPLNFAQPCGSPEAIGSWLDSRRDRSVVYVNFGSEIALSAAQAGEVAAGLEASGWCFLWAVKRPAGAEEDFVDGFLPEGFKERSGERGMVVAGWVPQEAILRHRAIGAFLSHCGWNSTVESVREGVPLVAWPFQHDQPFVKKVVVEEVGVGEEIRREGVGVVVKREEVERAVRAVMEGEEMRRRAGELKECVVGAVREGGSSFISLEKLAFFIAGLQSQ